MGNPDVAAPGSVDVDSEGTPNARRDPEYRQLSQFDGDPTRATKRHFHLPNAVQHLWMARVELERPSDLAVPAT
jgi:hypothetical protein